jgi:fructuronate reductase
VRLANAVLSRLDPAVARPAYDRAAQAAGIVHFGIGAFHRAHQAWYTDLAMNAGDRDWGIIGVSLRSAGVADQLNPQDGLYTVTENAADGQATRVVGAVQAVLVADQQAEAVIAAVAHPATRIISLTITEKGYCRAADGSLDPQLAGPGSVYRFIAAGLRRRHDRGLPGVTLLCCDNLANNGRQLDLLMRAYLDRHDPALLPWFTSACACPSTMVDRIVPATTEADLAATSARLGLSDYGAVMTERFSQWVIEDRFAGPRPCWDKVGAQIVADVAPYETAKLRMLNGAHSALAYIGLSRGHSYVHEAMADPEIRPLIDQLMLEEAMPTIARPDNLDLAVYASALRQRFENPALQHRLIQIGMDGSQKIPQRWCETLAANLAMGRACPAIRRAIDAWILHLRGANGPIDDPLAQQLATAAAYDDAVQRLFGKGGLLASSWAPDPA